MSRSARELLAGAYLVLLDTFRTCTRCNTLRRPHSFVLVAVADGKVVGCTGCTPKLV